MIDHDNKFDGKAKQEKTFSNEALKKIAEWWGERLVAKREDLRNLPFYNEISGEHGLNYSYYALVTHYCGNEENKKGIQELGGVIGVPDMFSVAYGEMATNQILHSLGDIKKDGYGEPFDGLTHVYLHGVGNELSDVCRNYFSALEAGPLAKAFGDREKLDPKKYLFQIELTIQAPWEGLTYNLTEGDGPKLLKEKLEKKIDCINFNSPGFQYRLRMLENKFLVAVL